MGRKKLDWDDVVWKRVRMGTRIDFDLMDFMFRFGGMVSNHRKGDALGE